MQMTQVALFPLQLFLLPGETTTLHIFEERYRQLLADCEDVQISFGIPFADNGTLTGYGTMVKLSKIIARHPDGSTDIEIEAMGIFKLKKFFLRMGEKLYPGGDVTMVEPGESPIVSKKLFAEYNELMNESDMVLSPESFSANLTLLDLARLLNLEDGKKIKLLSQTSAESKERFLLNEIKTMLLLIRQKNSVIGNIFLN